ncbi:MAG: SDR family oxidoreductase [Candidatus Zixiibacteriota bacterium]
MGHSDLRIMVTGAAGLLGFRLTTLLLDKFHVIAVTHEHDFPGSITAKLQTVKCDLTDRVSVSRLVHDFEPDVVINSAAMTDVDACEEKQILASKVNCDIVAHLIDAIKHDKTRFVQISTDYLFDGRNGPYPEEAVPNPLNVYGRTKLAAEQLVSEFNGESLIVRTSALFDNEDHGKANLFTAVYGRLKSGESVKVASDLYCNPIWTLNLSAAILEAVEQGLAGIMNIAGSQYLSRYDFALSMAHEYRFPRQLVQAVPLALLNRKAVRPLKAGVDVTKASKLLHTKLLSPEEAFTRIDFSGHGKN